jgi:hypothetical protein
MNNAQKWSSEDYKELVLTRGLLEAAELEAFEQSLGYLAFNLISLRPPIEPDEIDLLSVDPPDAIETSLLAVAMFSVLPLLRHQRKGLQTTSEQDVIALKFLHCALELDLLIQTEQLIFFKDMQAQLYFASELYNKPVFSQELFTRLYLPRYDSLWIFWTIHNKQVFEILAAFVQGSSHIAAESLVKALELFGRLDDTRTISFLMSHGSLIFVDG